MSADEQGDTATPQQDSTEDSKKENPQQRAVDLFYSQAKITPSFPRRQPQIEEDKDGIFTAWLGSNLFLGMTWLLFFTVMIFAVFMYFHERQFNENWRSLLIGTQELDCDFVDCIQDELRGISEIHAESRDSYLRFGETFFINLLLPLMTALLGYSFGTTRLQAKNLSNDQTSDS